MTKSILIELRAAINVSDFTFGKDYVESRVKDYVDGLYCFFEKLDKTKDCDVVFVENTHDSEDDLPEEILGALPQGTFMYVKKKNDYGKINKGAGDIEMWKEYLDKISEYDYFFHFEPRMLLNDASFLQSFLDNPRNVFCEDYDPGPPPRPAVKTGYFGVNAKQFVDYCNSVDLEEFVKNGTSIENHICLFFEDKDTEVMDNVKYCTRRWYNNSGGTGYSAY